MHKSHVEISDHVVVEFEPCRGRTAFAILVPIPFLQLAPAMGDLPPVCLCQQNRNEQADAKLVSVIRGSCIFVVLTPAARRIVTCGEKVCQENGAD